MKRLIGILFFVFTTSLAFAQKQDRPIVQFSGIVYNADSAKVIVPYVSITNASYNSAVTIANYKGYFSFVAHERDTLRFTAVGFAPQDIIIPVNVTNKSFTVQIQLKPQTINLPAFHVFPWATTDEFKKDFLSVKMADDDLENARKNLNRSSITAAIATQPRDAQEIQTALAQDRHIQTVNAHSLTPNPLLNPIAWGSLIKSITDGKKSNRNNND